MNFAVYGILADGVASGAGSFPVLLRAILERGHRVDFFGIRGYTEPRSLERFPHYRFVRVRVGFRRARSALRSLSAYASAFEAQVSHVGYHRQAVRSIEARQSDAHYDVIVCTDAQALCSSTLPIVCWPQSPPDSEGSSLRNRDIARLAIESDGLGRYGAVQLFYAYRWLVARWALGVSDLYVCGSEWARSEWARFGADTRRLRTLAYPIDVESFAETGSIGEGKDTVTFLWLGRATPRKRLDLFLAAFDLFHRREPRARARLVGNLNDTLATRLLAPYREHPAVRIDRAVRRTEIPRLLSEADVLVQPSQNENFGFSVAEALAAGRAVVLGPTNGTADYVGDAGHRFAEYRPESVAEAMGRAFEAVVQQGATVSARAREVAREHFGIQRVTDGFLALCSDLLASRTG